MEGQAQKRKFDDINKDGSEDDDIEQPPLKKTKGDPGNDQSQIELPPEIMLDILKLLPANQIPPVALVCRYWWICSKDESLAWIPFFPPTIDIQETKYTYYHFFNKMSSSVGAAREENLGKPAREAVPKGVLNRPGKYGRDLGHDFWLLDEQGNKIGVGETKGSIPLPDLKQSQYRYNIDYHVLNNDEERRTVLTIECNARRLEKLVRSRDNFEIDAWHWLTKQCIDIIKNMFDRKYDRDDHLMLGDGYLDQIYNPDEAYLPPALPLVNTAHLSEIKTKLHQYQLDAVNWMTFIERDREKTYDISPLIKIPQTELWMKFDLLKDYKIKAWLVPHEKFDEHNLYFQPKGGILADEMGLGKTLEVIALIFANPAPEELPTDRTLFSLRSTLVVCPTHLVQQWAREFEKHVTKKLKIVQASTLVELKKHTYQQILDADVVIVSQTIMSNRRYISWPDQAAPALKDEPIEKPHVRKLRLAKVFEDIKAQKKDLSKLKSPILDHFHWHRIVVDEAHEIVDQSSAVENPFELISAMPSTYNWYISGTPFLSADSFNNIRKFLKLQSKKYVGNHPAAVYFNSIVDEMIVQELMWRHTKESIAQEYKMVDTTEELILMDESPVEWLDYDQIGQSLASVKAASLAHCEQAIIDAQLCIDNWRKEIQSAEEYLSTPQPDPEHWLSYKRKFRAECNLKTLPESIELKLKSIEALQLKMTKIQPIVAESKIPEVNQYGTRGGHVLIYLKKLFMNDKTARVIIFGESSHHLRDLQKVLAENNITVALALGQVKHKVQAIKEFTEKDYHVIMMNITEMSSGTNLVEASHVIFLDQLHATDKNLVDATEEQAIGRARRQGQSRDITVVRFLMKNSSAYKRYLQMRAKPALHKTASKLTRSGSVGALTLSQSR